MPPFREVTGDLAESAQVAIFITKRGDDHVRPEAGAILAHAPSFVFKAPLFFSRFELRLSLALRHIFLRVKSREMLPDDLISLPTFEPFGRWTPGDYPAIGIENDDCIILYRVHEQLG